MIEREDSKTSGRQAAESAVARAYRQAQLPPPKEMVWHLSPRSAVADFLQRNRADQLSDRRMRPGSVRTALWAAAERIQVDLDDAAQPPVIRSHLMTDLVLGQLQEETADPLAWAAINAAHEPYRGEREHTVLAGAIAQACENAGWWWPERDFVLLSDLPTATHADAQERPHRAGGPAVEFADGWCAYAWHGLRVAAWVVNEPTVAQIADERNAEVRRCAIERIGWDRFIASAGLRLVHSCPDPGNPGCELQLYRLGRPMWPEEAGLLVATNGTPERDGTRRRYGLTVPPAVDTALGAAAWGYGLTAEEYAQCERRT